MGTVPFDIDIAHQRKRYGESLLRRTSELSESQEAYESSEIAKIEKARKEREIERQKLAEAEVSDETLDSQLSFKRPPTQIRIYFLPLI